ncbi:gluconokinase [Lacisediminihabitans profunda]|uniref:Gluconokinase n=2 Tax=Lacisediminihabitans profunda TaxID=2594790 RepID=A0A5C8USK8_9MICO|nr:gluconokinase [Lacisediminihabitans profunda]
MLHPAHERPSIVVMGVSGAGKTTTGILIADVLGVEFVDADSLHPQANRLKMAGGEPLTDEDRWPWLDEVGRAMALSANVGIVMACSALKRSYRDAIVRLAPSVQFVHLHAPTQLLAARVEQRAGHFMPSRLLASQLDALEVLASEECGVEVSVDGPIGDVVARAIAALESLAPHRRGPVGAR